MLITVNGREAEAREGETILSAVRRAGVTVPTLCHIDGLPPSGACRMCVVELEPEGRLVPSCSFPVAAGMRVLTHSRQAVEARRTIIELLLANHPDDCLYCPRSGSCELQRLAEELGVRQRRYAGSRSDWKMDLSSPAIVRDPSKCILCGKCVRVCEEVQGVSAIDFISRGSRARVGTAFDDGLNVSSCINCGQCVRVCPTGALVEKSAAAEVMEAIADPDRIVVVQHAPSISVTIAEEFGARPGTDSSGALNAALRKIGFDRVFDTSFSADLTIMEEAAELVARIRDGGPLPLLTSCSPGWIKFVEQFYPSFMPNLSSCKSPQQMMGALVKGWWAAREGIDPGRVFSVSIMPCTAKKFEAERPEMVREGIPDIDAVLTTRELARMIRMFGVDFARLSAEPPDSPMGERSSAGKIFGATGGVMEAAVRTAHHMLTGSELENLKIAPLRGLEGVKEAVVPMGGLEVRVAVASGLANARTILDGIREGRLSYHFVEVMTCPGGCIAGGGQPFGSDPETVRARMQALYGIDRDAAVRTSHSNPSVIRLYEEFLGEPGGHVAHELLHTRYAGRDVLL